MAVKEWYRVFELVGNNGVATAADLWVVACYADAFAEYAGFCQQLGNAKAVIDDKFDGTKKNPLYTLKQQAFARMVECAKQIGFSPLTRQKICARAESGNEFDNILDNVDAKELF